MVRNSRARLFRLDSGKRGRCSSQLATVSTARSVYCWSVMPTCPPVRVSRRKGAPSNAASKMPARETVPKRWTRVSASSPIRPRTTGRSSIGTAPVGKISVP